MRGYLVSACLMQKDLIRSNSARLSGKLLDKPKLAEQEGRDFFGTSWKMPGLVHGLNKDRGRERRKQIKHDPLVYRTDKMEDTGMLEEGERKVFSVLRENT